MSTVTIVGGHGKVALRAAPLLADNGHTVRSLIRKQEQADDVREAGAEPVVEDVTQLDEDQIADVFRGSDVVVWSAGAGGSGEEETWAIDRDAAIRTMEAAKKAGVQRYVMVSFFNSHMVDGEFPGVDKSEDMYAYFNAKVQADEHLRNSGLDWTIVGPSALTLDEPTGKIDVQEGIELRDVNVPTTSRGNVARVVAAAVDENKTIGKQINFHDGETPVAEALAAV